MNTDKLKPIEELAKECGIRLKESLFDIGQGKVIEGNAKQLEALRQAIIRDSAQRYETRIAELEKAICIYCREEIGHIDFENDKQAINYFIEYTNKFE